MAGKDKKKKSSAPLPVRLVIALLTNALLLGIVVAVLRNASTNDFGTLLEAAAVFGVLNTVVKPILRFATLPLAVLSLGIVWIFVSALMIVLTKDIVSGFHIHGFLTYMAATLIIWAVNLALDVLPGPWQITGSRSR